MRNPAVGSAPPWAGVTPAPCVKKKMRDFVPVRRGRANGESTSPVLSRERRPAASRPVGEGSGRIANACTLTFSVAPSFVSFRAKRRIPAPRLHRPLRKRPTRVRAADEGQNLSEIQTIQESLHRVLNQTDPERYSARNALTTSASTNYAFLKQASTLINRANANSLSVSGYLSCLSRYPYAEADISRGPTPTLSDQARQALINSANGHC
jgi:hypothetical protein